MNITQKVVDSLLNVLYLYIVKNALVHVSTKYIIHLIIVRPHFQSALFVLFINVTVIFCHTSYRKYVNISLELFNVLVDDMLFRRWFIITKQ